jgi:heme-degrading monooxygenase HmoA
MFARVVTVHMKTEYLDEAIRIYEESVVAYARTQEGFERVILLSDRDTGKICSVSVWETEDDMLAGERSSYLRDQFAKLAGFFSDRPVTEHFEVAVEG